MRKKINLFIKSENGRKPLIIVNLSTYTYRQVNVMDLLCGYQLNHIKMDFEEFMGKLQAAGSDLQFVFKKQNMRDSDWQQRRLDDYENAIKIIDEITRVKELEKLDWMFSNNDKLPYNSLILSSLIQSAMKFGKVHGLNENNGNPMSQFTELIKSEHADYAMGLNSYLFLTLDIKIWSDLDMNMAEYSAKEINPIIIRKKLNVKPDDVPLFSVLAGYLKSTPEVCLKVKNHFGTINSFQLISNFIYNARRISSPDTLIDTMVEKIFGRTQDNAKIVRDFRNSLDYFNVCIDKKTFRNITNERLERMQNDFTNFGEDILFNNLMFINPIFCDLRRDDIKSINELVMPLLEKTAGKLLFDVNDKADRYVMVLENIDEGFVTLTLKPKYLGPDFNLLRFAVDFPTEISIEFEKIPHEYHLDIYVLFYLLRNKSIRIIEAALAMKTLVDVRRRTIACDRDPPEIVSERA